MAVAAVRRYVRAVQEAGRFAARGRRREAHAVSREREPPAAPSATGGCALLVPLRMSLPRSGATFRRRRDARRRVAARGRQRGAQAVRIALRVRRGGSSGLEARFGHICNAEGSMTLAVGQPGIVSSLLYGKR